ncbi:Gamma interferon inducible lysosomal thiol reductase [Aphelenchoides besseyi]|nr:Gamma interferon inducible lysosomal thiol reductase [Aphelenchoides besseyi]KAI6211684.1 Gamma interferon inducible lysosomal thiol reductase [Aphelenchoides besseyi]
MFRFRAVPLGQKAFLPIHHNRKMNFKHRFLIRQYLYPAMCILGLFLLIRWNLEPRSVGLKDTEDFTVVKNIQKPQTLTTKSLGNVVSITVYMEAQCPDTTGFVRRNLLPTWRKLAHTSRLNVTIIPFGKATCQPQGEDFSCECQHGSDECELNALMNCVIEKEVHARDYIELIGCIQGQDDVNSASVQCLNEDANREWLVQCAKSRRGRYLLEMAGRRTGLLGTEFNFVPWVVLNGQRDIDSFYALMENVCKLLVPQPMECQNEQNNQIQRL